MRVSPGRRHSLGLCGSASLFCGGFSVRAGAFVVPGQVCHSDRQRLERDLGRVGVGAAGPARRHPKPVVALSLPPVCKGRRTTRDGVRRAGRTRFGCRRRTPATTTPPGPPPAHARRCAAWLRDRRCRRRRRRPARRSRCPWRLGISALRPVSLPCNDTEHVQGSLLTAAAANFGRSADTEAKFPARGDAMPATVGGRRALSLAWGRLPRRCRRAPDVIGAVNGPNAGRPDK